MCNDFQLLIEHITENGSSGLEKVQVGPAEKLFTQTVVAGWTNSQRPLRSRQLLEPSNTPSRTVEKAQASCTEVRVPDLNAQKAAESQ